MAIPKMTTPLYIPRLFGVSIEVYFILLVLAFPTFFIWCWLLKKFIKVDKTRKMATWAATLVATPLIYIGLIMIWFFSMSYYPTHDFDKQRWLTNKEKRYELSEDLVDSKMLIGNSKQEVRQLLGDEGNKDESNYWIYDLGFRPGFANIDPDILVIEFKDDKVVKVG